MQCFPCAIFVAYAIITVIYWYVMKTCARHKYWQIMMTWSNGNIFRVTDILCGIHRSPVNSYHKGQWRSALMFSFICAWINGWVHNREFGELRRHRAHYDVIAMLYVSNVYTSTQGRRTNHRQHIRHKSKVNYPLTQCLIYCDFNFDLYRIRYFFAMDSNKSTCRIAIYYPWKLYGYINLCRAVHQGH